MNWLYRIMFAAFPLAVFLSGVCLALSANLMIDIFRENPLNLPHLIASILFLVCSASFTALHSDFSKINADARSLAETGGGIVSGEDLTPDMLKKKRVRIVILTCLGFLSLILSFLVASGVPLVLKVLRINPGASAS